MSAKRTIYIAALPHNNYSLFIIQFSVLIKKYRLPELGKPIFLFVSNQILWAFTLTPGPIVEAVTQLLMYWPFAAAGLALMMASIRVL